MGPHIGPGLQLDQIAPPILLAWRLHKHDAARSVRSSRDDCARRGVPDPARAGDSTGSLGGKRRLFAFDAGHVIAALVCAAEWGRETGNTDAADFIFAYADWLAAHVEEWTVTTEGELVAGFPRHYIRINPTDPEAPDPHADPNTTMIQIANGGGLHPARNIVGGDFLHLVRFGIRGANDPLVRDSIEVIDRVLKHDLPQGPGWRRYNHDGYGQKDDGSAFDGTGVGRCWPILTGERGHYELAAGRDPIPFIRTMENFANEGGMITEQVWDGDDLPDARMKRGCPTGAAMPLCWSHAEYVSLVRSRHDGVCFDRVEPAFQRYVVNPVPEPVRDLELCAIRCGVWRAEKSCGSSSRQRQPSSGQSDNWARTNESDSIHQNELNLWFRRFSNLGMAGWIYACVYIFLEARSTLGKPQLAGEPYLKLSSDCEARRAATLAATNATTSCT